MYARACMLIHGYIGTENARSFDDQDQAIPRDKEHAKAYSCYYCWNNSYSQGWIFPSSSLKGTAAIPCSDSPEDLTLFVTGLVIVFYLPPFYSFASVPVHMLPVSFLPYSHTYTTNLPLMYSYYRPFLCVAINFDFDSQTPCQLEPGMARMPLKTAREDSPRILRNKYYYLRSFE